MLEPIQISSLNQFVFCSRRFALIHIEGVWLDNEHTIRGSNLHQHADQRGYEVIGKSTLLRALRLHSAVHNLTGLADIVEVRDGEYIPVEYKKGRRREFENDNVQLAAQALCLEEMFETQVNRGFVYHAASKKRREVLIDAALRNETVSVIEQVKQLLNAGTIPRAMFRPRCEGCSLFDVCLPRLSDPEQRVALEVIYD